MERPFTQKLDANLLIIYNDYLEREKKLRQRSHLPEQEGKAPSNVYNLSLRYQNDLPPIEELGFKTSWNALPGIANGYVHLKDLERIAEHPNVVSLTYGARPRINLNESVKDIKVRSDAIGNIGTNGLWHIDTSTGTITSVPPTGFSGNGVIVGIIDTGIDISHPSFTTGTSPSLSSRILRLWDQGLAPAAAPGRTGPDPALLTVTNTYGIEFDKPSIESLINAGTSGPSRDCVGHGTHVAAISAGNGNPGEGFPPVITRGDFDFVGVAPEADIVVVKFLDVPDTIRDTASQEVSNTTRFRDAIMYILNVARAEGKPTVINCSFGSSLGPHDGLDEDEQFLDALFAPGSSYYSGNILVNSAGNSSGDRHHARITMPASGEITIPFTLFDKRRNKQEYKECRWQDSTTDLYIDIWYKEVSAPDDVAVQVKVPTDSSFSAQVFSGFLTKRFDGNKRRTIHHTAIPPVNRPTGGGAAVSVRRNEILLIVEPNRRTDPAQHRTGLYEIKITGPASLELHVWTLVPESLFGFRVGTFTELTVDATTGDATLTVHDASGFKVSDSVEVGLNAGGPHVTTITGIVFGAAPDTDQITIASPLPSAADSGKTVTGILVPDITVEDRFLMDSAAGAKNVIAVAAYDDNNGSTASPYRHITGFSSRGPLMDYSGLGPNAPKPDIAAPGFNIRSAKSQDMDGGVGLSLAELFGNRFIDFSGTSMSAPHVAGLVALLLQKDGTLNVDQVRTIFSTLANVQNGIDPAPASGIPYQEAFGGGIIDGKKSIDAIP